MPHSNLEVAIPWDRMRACVVLSGDCWTRESVFECGPKKGARANFQKAKLEE